MANARPLGGARRSARRRKDERRDRCQPKEWCPTSPGISSLTILETVSIEGLGEQFVDQDKFI